MWTLKTIHLERENLQFSVFTSEDINKLSVAKIITGLSFDILGRPLSGGLYDLLMGTSGKSSDPCATCLEFGNCPGHLGHIELHILLYNPFFQRIIYDILRLSCLSCFKLQFTEHAQKVQLLQFELINAGYIIEAKDLGIYKSEMVGLSKSAIKTESGNLLHPKLAEMEELLSKGPNTNITETKTSCDIRAEVIRDILQSIPSAKKCMFCHEKLKKIKFLYKRLVMSLTKEDKEKLSEQNIEQTKGNKVILADECRYYLRQVYDNHSKLLNEIFPLLKTCSRNIESPVDVLFMDVVPVTPPKSRPINKLNNVIIEHPQTVIYKNILNSNSILKLIIENVKKNGEGLKDEAKAIFDNFKGSTSFEKVYFAWQELQNNVDTLLDSSIDKSMQGLKQILEKKEGLIRKHMMGKRVNYAARTVITPDPNISVDEVGIPDIFAKKLSYPVPVSPWNISLLRKMVMNGPDIHPGANYIEDEKGFKTMIPADNPSKRESYAKLLYSKSQNDGIKIVHRHLINGDALLLNRQPTLHKPSIMAHKARILPGEKTFRLHYSNCKAYNADFDGDEMNAHFPQNELARSEAYNIVNVANQYLVPKDGTPLGGLIQDHVISGVKLSLRGRFFNSEDYQQLVYQGLSSLEQREIKCLPPTILKPFKLWSGKQVLSTIIMNIIPEGYPLVNLTSTAKVGTKHWKVAAEREWVCGGTPLSEIEMSESEVIIREGELLVGVLDKEQYGATKFGLIHCMYELYGGDCSTQLLTAFTRVFTYFLQKEGFTLGVQDILVTSHADHKRRKIIRQCRRKGNEIAATALNLNEVPEPDVLAGKLEEAYQKDPKFRVILDRNYKSVLDKYTNEINQTCLPGGLISKFPQNNLQLMVLSGAKGSMVNTMQISCLLGQIELEGKRPPLMISGKSLPSFATFETSPKSGGFIDGRFMTGIQPQDFFFHCMAGREGLIDTAVKTSRSGYLQRCLIKHLEGLSVAYDLTVRDSDNSIVQFLYGEDGLDVTKSKFFNPKALKILDENRKVILHKKQLEEVRDDQSFIKICKILKKIKSWKKKNGDPNQKRRHSAFQKFSDEIIKEIEIDKPNELKKNGRTNLSHKITKLWQKADEEKRKIYGKKYTKCPEPIVATYKPDNFYGAVSEYLEDLMENYMKKKKDRNNDVKDIVYLKAMQSLAQPGEPVGLLAAQSIGEPSTQMTLNTFHFAGRGEMNVTLGIPRLREILMLASANIKTPSMDIPFKENKVQRADKLRVKFNRVTLADVLEYVNVKLKLVIKPSRFYVYTLYFKFLPRDAYSDEFCVKPKQIIKYMSNVFFKLMFRAMSQSIKSKCTIIDIDENSSKEKNGNEIKEPEDDDMDNTRADTNKDKIVDVADSSDDENVDADEDDTTGIKLKNRKHDENEYDDPEVEEEVQDANENDDDVEVEFNDQDISTEDAENDLQNELLMNNDMVNEYKYDRENYLWCQLTFSLPMKYKNLDISSILKGLAHKSVVYQIPNIKRAITYKNNNDLVLKTEGINISEMFNYDKFLDLNRLYSNDIHSIAKVYGIEAANRVIVKEVQNVFKVYGIEVDLRHLLMIADYMTFDGTFKPLSRKGLENSASPLQQMSFESCLQFLKQAVFYGRKDDLLSPSSRLMVGLPVKSGTGLFSIYAEAGTNLC